MRKRTTAENLEERFNAGEDVLDYFAVDRAVRRNHEKVRVSLDLPRWLLREIDRLASRHGIPRQSQIKALLVERLKAERAESCQTD